jgi:hypothetical protein
MNRSILGEKYKVLNKSISFISIQSEGRAHNKIIRIETLVTVSRTSGGI